MTDHINNNYLLRTLEELLNIPSPSGYCYNIMNVIENKITKFGLSMELTNKGCGVVTVPGEQDDYVIGVSAHLDTLGAMVKSIKPNGYLAIAPIGGFMMNSIEGEYCRIHTRSKSTYTGTILTTHPSVHVYKDARTQARDAENMEIRIDEDVSSDEDVKILGIKVGDIISFNPRTEILKNGFIKSRHLDDKAGVAILLSILEHITLNKLVPKCTIKFFISTYEEVGHGGAYIPHDINELIAIDMGAIGDDLSCTEKQVSICAKDSSGPYDYNMVSELVNICDANNIDYAIDIYPYYGSDVSASLKGGNNIKGALIGPGVHGSHGMERTHTNALKNTAKLLLHYLIH